MTRAAPAHGPLQDLHKFRASHPARTTAINGITWEYIACGQGPETLMLLPGAPGRADTAFQHILAFENDYRIVAPGFPAPLNRLDDMLDGLAGILRAENVGKAHVVGGSYSGLIAQSFVRRHPDIVHNLVLSDTGVPRPDRAKKYGRYMLLLKSLPVQAIRTLWRLGANIYLREIPVDKAFWRAYFYKLASTITKQECVGRLQIWIEFDKHSRFTQRDLAVWPGKILILETATDTTFPPHERAALHTLYPNAETIAFHHGGHAASIAHRADYIAAIRRFLEERDEGYVIRDTGGR